MLFPRYPRREKDGTGSHHRAAHDRMFQADDLLALTNRWLWGQGIPTLSFSTCAVKEKVTVIVPYWV